jgi:hypothetical protein
MDIVAEHKRNQTMASILKTYDAAPTSRFMGSSFMASGFMPMCCR